MSAPQGIWVIAELSSQGNLLDASQELMTPAHQLAKELSEPLTIVLLVGDSVSTVLAEQQVQGLGAQNVIILRHGQFATYQVEAWTMALSDLIQSKNPKVVLLDSSVNTLDYAPRLTVRTKGSLITQALELTVNTDRNVNVTRACYAEALLTQVGINSNGKPNNEVVGPQFITVKKKAFAKPSPQSQATEAAPIFENITPDLSTLQVKVERISLQVLESKGLKKLEDADIVVSGGRGLKGPENFHWVEDLAAALGGAVGASRAVVDAGWRPHAEQVGQTGKTVTPKLYIALGISGALQHQVGMSSSQIIIAVNRDENAPIFKMADFGIIGDALEIVPAFIKTLQVSHT